MIQLKHFLALLMAATVLWLLHILSNYLDLTATILILSLVVAIFLSFKISDKILKYAAIILLAGSAFALPGDFQKRSQPKTDHAEGLWQTFNEEEIYRQVREGKTVLVDVTADWCITCKFNKINVLQSAEVVLLLKRGEIIGMRGDITKPNQEIMKFMRKHNRFAIPFNAVYGPSATKGLLASELLNKSELLKLIKQAK
jgi:suppressor for copper-sensitivity B